jgi:hypothetical protein
LPGGLGRSVALAARQEFVAGLGIALLVAAVVVAIAAAVVFAYLPARDADDREIVAGPVDGFASAAFAEAEGALHVDEVGAA